MKIWENKATARFRQKMSKTDVEEISNLFLSFWGCGLRRLQGNKAESGSELVRLHLVKLKHRPEF